MPYHHAYWHNYYRRPFMFCGPSRLIWFGIGSVATWAWIRHHENERFQGRGWCPSPRSRIDYRAQPQPQTQTQTQTAQNPSREWNDYPMMASQGGQGQGTSGTAPGTTNAVAPPPSPPPPLQSSPAAAEQEYERVRQMRRDAEETVSQKSQSLSSATVPVWRSGSLVRSFVPSAKGVVTIDREERK
jgi:hypothetical protein